MQNCSLIYFAAAHYTSQWRRIAYKNMTSACRSIRNKVCWPQKTTRSTKQSILRWHYYSHYINQETNFVTENGFPSILLPGFCIFMGQKLVSKEYLPSGLDVCHYAGNSSLVAAAASYSSGKLFLVAGNMGFEVALVGLRLVKRGQSCVVSQPQTVATFVDMQRDAAVHRMPVMMIVHEMREGTLVLLITVHWKMKWRCQQ